MFTMVVAATALGFGGLPADSYGSMYDPQRDPRPIATMPGPVVNGRLWVSRPHIGPASGPLVPQFRSPGPEYYGALDDVDARVPVRVVHLVVSISPWEQIDKPGLRRFEEARQFWLYENNYTGGVRTFVNDLHLWDPPAAHADAQDVQDVQTFTRDVDASRDVDSVPEPRATIQLNPDQPRQRRPLRVENSRGGEAALVLSSEPGRISWPPSASVEVVERSRSRIYSVASRD